MVVGVVSAAVPHFEMLMGIAFAVWFNIKGEPKTQMTPACDDGQLYDFNTHTETITHL